MFPVPLSIQDDEFSTYGRRHRDMLIFICPGISVIRLGGG